MTQAAGTTRTWAEGWPEDDMLHAAWGLICNSGAFDHPEMASPGWVEAAHRWRDVYHAMLRELYPEKASEDA